jgi:hypothetical protein
MTEPAEVRPPTTEEAAEIVRNDPALNTATAGNAPDDDAATDDDARTPDSATAGDNRD